MRQTLNLHPDSCCPAVTRIDVEVERPRPGRLTLRYAVAGRIDGLRLPAATAPGRADALWRHTCFEAFLRVPSDDGYYEFNLAPSTRWAAYRFAGYRSDRRDAREVAAPGIDVRSDAGCCALRASLDLDRLPGLADDAAWRLALAAVIEETNGRLSHWALAHPPGRADFHHPDGFLCKLETAARP